MKLRRIGATMAAVAVVAATGMGATQCGGTGAVNSTAPSKPAVSSGAFTECRGSVPSFRLSSNGNLYVDVRFSCHIRPQSFLIAVYLDYRQGGVWKTVGSDSSTAILMQPRQEGGLQAGAPCLKGDWKADVYWGGVTRAGRAVKAVQRGSFTYYVSSCSNASTAAAETGIGVTTAHAAAAGPRPHPRTYTICARDELLKVTGYSGSYYKLRNDTWGDRQCITNRNHWSNFTVTRSTANATGSESVAFPNIFAGCEWGKCTGGSFMPLPVSRAGSVRTTWTLTHAIPGGIWNAAYDIWFTRTRQVSGQAQGGEIMIWLRVHDFPPVPSWARLVRIDGFRFWFVPWRACLHGRCWSYMQYRAYRTLNGLRDLRIYPFITHGIATGWLRRTEWLMNIEAGFEIWSGGRGLGTSFFSVHR